jgi:hypothetical protein
MFDTIPEDIVARYGYFTESMFGDDYLILKSEFRKKIIGVLINYVYSCEENWDLVAKALGFHY